MNSLKDALKTPAQVKGSSLKTPKFYNQQKMAFIKEMSVSPNESTRVEVAGSSYVPAGTLKSMLQDEQDIDVLRIILLNPRTPLKAITIFTDDARANVFDDDEEITTHLKARVNISADSSDED